MSGLCGWFTNGASDPGDTTIAAMANTDQHAAPARIDAGACGALAAAGGAGLVRDGSWVLAFTGHPRLRDGAGTDPHALLSLLRLEGRQALSRIGGDFALAAWNSAERKGLLAVDRMGVQQIVHAEVGATLAFGSTLDMLRAFPGAGSRLSPQGLFDYLYFHVVPGPRTVFEGLHRLPAGHCIEFGPGKRPVPKPYWTLRFEEQPLADFETQKAEFVSLLASSVRDAAEGASSCGSFLSGGTDSSTISGMLARTTGGAKTFSIGFDVQGYDEMEYARIAARHFRCEHHEYYVTPDDVVSALPRIAAAYDQPFGNASAIPTYYCAKLAKDHGIHRLLAGDGGDELFGGNERYAKQHLLEAYQRVPKALRRGLLEPLAAIPGLARVPVVRKVCSYVAQARQPMPDRYESYNLLSHLGIAKVFEPEFLSSTDPAHPLALLRDAHAPHMQASLINQMLAIDIRFVLTDADLPKVARMCELAGVDVAFPMLDDRLVTFSERLPAAFKLRDTQLRWFFKQALLDFLPPEVITKQKHGFGLPVGAWLVGHRPLLDLARDSIELLRHRRIVKPAFVDELLTRRLHEHPPYYGTMVWILMMLGLWLDSRRL